MGLVLLPQLGLIPRWLGARVHLQALTGYQVRFTKGRLRSQCTVAMHRDVHQVSTADLLGSVYHPKGGQGRTTGIQLWSIHLSLWGDDTKLLSAP